LHYNGEDFYKMKFILLHKSFQAELVDAINLAYEAWKIKDEAWTQDLRSKGIIVCYSQMHLLYEEPLSAVRLAETVSFRDGVLGPPQDNPENHFFLLGTNYKPGLPDRLEHHGYSLMADVIRNAAEITIPEVHCFTDADGDDFEIVGWDQADAQNRIEQSPRVKLPGSWQGSWLAFPCGTDPVFIRRHEFSEYEEGPVSETEAESASNGIVGSRESEQSDDGPDEGIPF
jgi:hypothetical protein